MIYDFEALARVLEGVPQNAPAEFAEYLEAFPRIFVYGAGRSGLMLKGFAMRLAQAGKTVFVAGETVTPAVEEGDLLVLASASGTTESVCRYARIAKNAGARVFCITADGASTAATLADGTILLSAPSKDRASDGSIMGTLFEQALLLFCDRTVACLPRDPEELRRRHANLE